MKRLVFALLFLTSVVSACAPSATRLSREDLLEHLAPMRDLDLRFERLQSSATVAAGLGAGINDGNGELFRNHLDLYWAHYYAAQVAIANDDLERFSRHIHLSESEMDAMESMIHEAIRGLRPDRALLQQHPQLNF